MSLSKWYFLRTNVQYVSKGGFKETYRWGIGWCIQIILHYVNKQLFLFIFSCMERTNYIVPSTYSLNSSPQVNCSPIVYLYSKISHRFTYASIFYTYVILPVHRDIHPDLFRPCTLQNQAFLLFPKYQKNSFFCAEIKEFDTC